ncbi:hypothetical protein [Polaromonas sp. YR568]|uniref:hypothetical protein n=1 Tax=Polaromonas sp. YR568 TaxID=1855301 RepID=UPI003137973C
MFRASHTPPLSILLDDLLISDPAAIAAHLGVTTQTLKHWKATDKAPRAALLALFYETRWGYSLIETTAHNGHIRELQHRQCLERENAMLRARIARLERLGGFGAANAPVLAVR